MTFLTGAADYRGFEALVCSSPSPSASEEGRGSVGVIRWFHRWRDPSKRKEPLWLLPAEGFHTEAART